MGIIYHPQPGTILRVDFSEGFRTPEMVKRRPAIVISSKLVDREGLCAIVPLSTTAPRTRRDYHCELILEDPLPRPFDTPHMWVKADMVQTVAFHRLALLTRGKLRSGERIYDVRVISPEKLAEVKACVAHALGIPSF